MWGCIYEKNFIFNNLLVNNYFNSIDGFFAERKI